VDTEEEQREILHRRLQDRLHDYRKQLADWHDKLKRLRHRVCKVPRESRFRSEFEEASTATLLVSLQLKAHVMVNVALQRVPRLFDFERYARLSAFFADNIIALRDAIYDRHSVGLGVLQLYVDDDGNPALRSVSPEDVYYDPRRGFRNPHAVFRRFAVDDDSKYDSKEVYEFYDPFSHVLFNDKEVIDVQPNLLGHVPFYLLPCILPGRDIYPIADGELALPQQQLLDEIRRTLLDSARRGKPVTEYRVGDIEEAELQALESGERVVIGTSTGQSLRVVAMPVSTSEWSALEQLARQDMDSLLGISDILRSTLTSSEMSARMTATQALAELALQNARLAADSIELEAALRRIAEDWHLLVFGEPAQFASSQPPPNPIEQALGAGSDIATSLAVK
jgi:nucleotide-binding universal stress UspA family protein